MADLNFGTVFENLYSTTIETLSASSGLLIGDGQDLASTLLLITASWIIVIWLLSGDGVTALMDSLGVMLRFSIVSIMLLSWLSMVGGFFQGTATDIGGRLATVSIGGASSTPGGRVADTLNTIMIGAGRLLSSERTAPRTECKQPVATPGPEAPWIPGETAEDCVLAAGQNAELSWADLLKYFPAIMFTWLLRLVALFFMGMMATAYLAVVFLAEIMFGVGITLGPILIPWLIWQRTEFLFDGWLRFMIVGTLTKIIAGFMTSLMTGIIIAVKRVSEQIEVRDAASLVAVDEFTAFLLCIVAALGSFFMWQVPGLAQGLMSGSSGIAMKGLSKGSTGQALSKAPGGAMKMAVATLQNIDKLAGAMKSKGGGK